MENDTFKAILTEENLAKIFPKEKTDEFFEALFGDASEGSYDIELAYREAGSNTLVMDLVLKDIGLFQKIAEKHKVPLEISPMIIDIMKDGQKRYGERANSDDIIRRLEEATGLSILADGFPAELVDDEPEEKGYEVVPPGR